MTTELAAARLPKLHRAWRLLPQEARRAVLRQGLAWLAPRPDHPPPPVRAGIAVGGELDRASGVGEAARLTLHALRVLNVPSWPVHSGERPPPAGAPLILHVNAPSLPLAMLRFGRSVVHRRRIVGYWPWELPVVPESWRIGLPFVHEVWAPSRFSATALQRIAPSVRVVPYPVAACPPTPSALSRADFGLPEEAVITLVAFNLASSYARKNPLAAIAAHRAAFGGRSDRLLLIRVGTPHHFPDDFRDLQAAAAALPNVRLDTSTLERDDAHAVMACCDIVLSLHRSEGFGLVPAEAMLLGKPVIATDWSGNLDFMDPDCAAMVPARLIPARDPRGVFEAPGAVWADPDIEVAANWLARLAGDEALRAQLGAAGRAAAQARLGPGPLASAVRSLGLAV